MEGCVVRAVVLVRAGVGISIRTVSGSDGTRLVLTDVRVLVRGLIVGRVVGAVVVVGTKVDGFFGTGVVFTFEGVIIGRFNIGRGVVADVVGTGAVVFIGKLFINKSVGIMHGV